MGARKRAKIKTNLKQKQSFISFDLWMICFDFSCVSTMKAIDVNFATSSVVLQAPWRHTARQVGRRTAKGCVFFLVQGC
jgi:hypothetical protein